MRRGVAAVALAGLAAAALVAAKGGAAAGDADDALHRDVEPFLKTWCMKCHSGAEPEGGLDMAKLVAAQGAEADDGWRDVRRQLRRRAMPPKKAPQPPDADVARVLAWIESRAGAQSMAAVDPGRTTLRRLSRFEYRCTVRD